MAGQGRGAAAGGHADVLTHHNRAVPTGVRRCLPGQLLAGHRAGGEPGIWRPSYLPHLFGPEQDGPAQTQALPTQATTFPAPELNGQGPTQTSRAMTSSSAATRSPPPRAGPHPQGPGDSSPDTEMGSGLETATQPPPPGRFSPQRDCGLVPKLTRSPSAAHGAPGSHSSERDPQTACPAQGHGSPACPTREMTALRRGGLGRGAGESRVAGALGQHPGAPPRCPPHRLWRLPASGSEHTRGCGHRGPSKREMRRISKPSTQQRTKNISFPYQSRVQSITLGTPCVKPIMILKLIAPVLTGVLMWLPTPLRGPHVRPTWPSRWPGSRARLGAGQGRPRPTAGPGCCAPLRPPQPE